MEKLRQELLQQDAQTTSSGAKAALPDLQRTLGEATNSSLAGMLQQKVLLQPFVNKRLSDIAVFTDWVREQFAERRKLARDATKFTQDTLYRANDLAGKTSQLSTEGKEELEEQLLDLKTLAEKMTTRAEVRRSSAVRDVHSSLKGIQGQMEALLKQEENRGEAEIKDVKRSLQKSEANVREFPRFEKNAQKQNDYFVAKVKSLLTDAKGNTAQANAALTEEEKEGKRRIAALIPKFSGTLDEKVRLAANQYQSNTDIAKAEAEGKITETARRAEALLKKANKNIDQFDTHFKKDEKAINKECKFFP